MIPAPLGSPELAAAANCAGAFLLFLQFVLLAVAGVLLHFAWRGLISSRRSLPEAMELVLGYIEKLQSGTQATTGAVVEPQIALASRLAGLRAGVSSLLGRQRRPAQAARPGTDAAGEERPGQAVPGGAEVTGPVEPKLSE